MAMAMAMAKKQKNEVWRKLRHKSGCCCFGWAVYAPWACYMNLRALYVSKLAKCPLTCLADLAGDLKRIVSSGLSAHVPAYYSGLATVALHSTWRPPLFMELP